jgi:hypothetical protein
MIWIAVYEGDDSLTVSSFESIEEARTKFPEKKIQQMRVCTKCGHAECPMCNDSCDVLVGDDFDPCCDGQCTYDQSQQFDALTPTGAGSVPPS